MSARFDEALGVRRGLDEEARVQRDRAARADVRAAALRDREMREAAARERNPGRFAADGYEFDTGVCAEYPDDEGRIRLRDGDGDLSGWYNIGDDEWAGVAELFGNIAEDFAGDDEDKDEF
jgi:hypothetical protein